MKWCPRWRVEPLCVGSVVVMQLLGIDIKGRKTNVRNISRMDPEKVFCFRRVDPMVLNPGGVGPLVGFGEAAGAAECLQWLDRECESGWTGPRPEAA